MKKSIKYAGIAAATLLAVAPVAAPVVSNVTTVKADAGNTPASDLQSAKDNFKDQFGDVNVSSTGTYNNLTLGKTAATDVTAFNAANTSVIKDAISTEDATLLTNKKVNVYMEAEDANHYVYDGTVNHTSQNLSDAIAASDDNLPVTFTVYAQINRDVNGTGDGYEKVATFNLKKQNDGNELKSINAKFTTPITVAKNSKVKQTQLVNSTDVNITDQDGKSVSTTGTTLGKGYFRTYSGAMDAVKAGTQDASDTTLASDITDEFKTAGTYYQVVTYKVGSDTPLKTFLDAYNNDTSKYTIYVNGKAASAGYDFVSKDADTTATPATDATISFVRAINVSDSESTWTTTDTTGVVTTKTDHSFYTLKDDDGNTVTNRALAKNTAWKTNAVRTDQNGNKQYRVGASEWIDANDVTFSDKATDNNGEGAYTDVKALNGKVTTAGPEGFYYPLYDDNGKMVTNRGVAGLSAWYTDKSAVNADGVTVYHVATGEWLQGTNVTYTAY